VLAQPGEKKTQGRKRKGGERYRGGTRVSLCKLTFATTTRRRSQNQVSFNTYNLSAMLQERQNAQYTLESKKWRTGPESIKNPAGEGGGTASGSCATDQSVIGPTSWKTRAHTRVQGTASRSRTLMVINTHEVARRESRKKGGKRGTHRICQEMDWFIKRAESGSYARMARKCNKTAWQTRRRRERVRKRATVAGSGKERSRWRMPPP